MSVFLMPFLKLLSVSADLSSRLILAKEVAQNVWESACAVFCSVETFLSEVCVCEVIVGVTTVK